MSHSMRTFQRVPSSAIKGRSCRWLGGIDLQTIGVGAKSLPESLLVISHYCYQQADILDILVRQNCSVQQWLHHELCSMVNYFGYHDTIRMIAIKLFHDSNKKIKILIFCLSDAARSSNLLLVSSILCTKKHFVRWIFPSIEISSSRLSFKTSWKFR